MIDIIKLELFRIKKSVLFWVMLGLSFLLPILSAVLLSAIIGIIQSISDSVGSLDISAWDLIVNQGLTASLLSALPQIASDVAIISVIATSVILCKEFSDGTMRNVLLANKTRAELYFGHLISAVIISLSFLAGNFVSIMIVIAPIFGFNNLAAGQAATACLCSLAQGLLVMLFVSSCVCMFMFGVRKQWAAVLFPLLICMVVPNLLTTVVTIIGTVMTVGGQVMSTDALRFVPFVGGALYNAADVDGVVVGMNILYLSVFTAVFVVAGYYTFKKADLK